MWPQGLLPPLSSSNRAHIAGSGTAPWSAKQGRGARRWQGAWAPPTRAQGSRCHTRQGKAAPGLGTRASPAWPTRCSAAGATGVLGQGAHPALHTKGRARGLKRRGSRHGQSLADLGASRSDSIGEERGEGREVKVCMGVAGVTLGTGESRVERLRAQRKRRIKKQRTMKVCSLGEKTSLESRRKKSIDVEPKI